MADASVMPGRGRVRRPSRRGLRLGAPLSRTELTEAATGSVPTWPLAVAFIGYPIWWLLGLSWAVWAIVALPMLVSLRGTTRIPRGFWIWAGLLFATCFSLPLAAGPHDVGSWLYRSEGYFAAAVIFLYIYNLPDAARVARKYVAAFFWVALLSGAAALLVPDFSLTTPVGRVLAHGSGTGFFGTRAVVTLRGLNIAGQSRPTGVFPTANQWGGVIAICLPVAAVALYSLNRRRVLTAALIAAVPLVVLSRDRALWLALGVAGLYIGFRSLRRGSSRLLGGVLAGAGVLALLVFLTPLHTVIQEKLASSSSVDARQSVYVSTWQAFKSSPLIGHIGTGTTSFGAQSLAAPTGTQGQFWTLIYNGGLPATILFYAWFAAVLWRTRGSSSALAAGFRLGLIGALIVSFVYALAPDGIVIMLVCCAGLLKVTEDEAVQPTSAPP